MEPAGSEGLAALATAMTALGAGPDDPAALADRISRTGLIAQMGSALTGVHLDNRGLRDALPSAATLVADAVLRPRYRTPALERQLASLLAGARVRSETPAYQSMISFHRALLGDAHRLARPMPAALTLGDTLDLDALEAFHAELWRPSDTIILVAGDADIDVTAALFDTAMAGWSSPATPPPPLRLAVETARPSIRVFDSTGNPTVQVAMGWVRPGLSDAQRLDFACIMHALAGAITSRPNQRLRAEKGLTYSVTGGSGMFAPRIGPHFGMIRTTIDAGRIGEAIGDIQTLIDDVRGTAPIRADEIEDFRHSERQRLARLN